MATILFLLSIIKTLATGLGVGSSTIAIANFFVAIYDGKIDPLERRMMQVTYVVLRVAMTVILVTTLTLLSVHIIEQGLAALTPVVLAEITILFVLYANAVLMTLRIMPSTVGPALQASSWYALGITAALVAMGMTHFNFTQFMLGYIAFFLLAATGVNAGMHYLKPTKKPA